MSLQKYHLVRQHIDHHLSLRLRIYLFICLTMIVLIIVDVLRDTIGAGLATIGIVLGMVLGLIVSRMYQLKWDEETTKVIAQIDWVGGIILVLYIAFLFSRDWLFGHWVQAATLAAFGLSVTAGSMFARIIFARHGIHKTLQAISVLK